MIGSLLAQPTLDMGAIKCLARDGLEIGNTMKVVLKSVGALLISAAILLAGGGLLSTLVAIRASDEGFPLLAIGLMTSTYYAGFISGCLFTPHLVKRVGHVRVFAALSALTAAGALLHVIFINVPVWIVLRGIIGFTFAGLYLLIESWINEQAPNEKRGQVLSIYRMVDLAAVTAGQFMLTLSSPDGFVLFSLVAICVCVAIFPISLSTAKAPGAVTETSLNLRKLIRVSPLAFMGCFVVGLTNGAFWGIAPIFVQSSGYDVLMVSIFMSVVIFAGAMLQWPVGWLSDQYGRRIMLLLMSVGGVGAGLFIWILSTQSAMFMLIGGALYGLFAMSIFGLSAAHANDRAEPHEFVAISGALLLVYGAGSIVGPSVGAGFMNAFGPSALFAYTAIIHASFAIYTLLRMLRKDGPETEADYVRVASPRSMAIMRRIDPRVKRVKGKRRAKGAFPH